MTANIQELVNVISEVGRTERSKYHLTLGRFIEFLEKQRGDIPVFCDIGGTVGKEASYRGYYSDLAFEPAKGSVIVQDLLEQCILARGHTYEGYKGGDFVMEDDTPLWLCYYGTTAGARAIIDIEIEKGEPIILLITKDVGD